MKKIKWGIVGAGIIAHQFAKDIAFVDNASLAAVASNSCERGNSFAEQYKIPSVYNTYKQLYDDPQVDAVYVATPHNFHLKNSSDALRAGKAVLCEKPLTDNLEDSKCLIELAKELDVYMVEGMWTYFLPAIKKAKEWVDAGRIGKVINVKADFGYTKEFNPKSRLFNPELSGGCLLDMGIYTIAMAQYFLQGDPYRMNVALTKAPTGVDYDDNMQFLYDDAVANLHSSFRAKLSNHTYIIGEKGYIDIPDFWRARQCFIYEEEKVLEHFQDNRKGGGFEYEIEDVSNDIIHGKKESTIVPQATSLKFQEQMKAVLSRM